MRKGKVIQFNKNRTNGCLATDQGIGNDLKGDGGLTGVHKSDPILELIENLKILALVEAYGAEVVSNALKDERNAGLEIGI
ncbi:MAG: hypothetical protein A2Y24_00110 [Clostridiales bacterium GWE2_32_10]|nr:MAG: hypothetical protein A2Y24_00110 [Clostridiales bacterium GWE2_32_10]